LTAARRSNAALIERARDGIERCGAGCADGIDHRHETGYELVGRGGLDAATEQAGDLDVAGIAELCAAGMSYRRILVTSEAGGSGLSLRCDDPRFRR
jgi:hypothetical protein